MRSLVEGPLNRGEEDLLVRDVMTNGCWSFENLSFDLLENMVNAIKAIPIRRFSRNVDQQCWISSANGSFEPRNAYLLAIEEDLSTPDFNGKWIWKAHTLPKIQTFLWKFHHQSLPINVILEARGIDGLGGCGSCSEARESILHVLRDCPIAQAFWRQSNCPPSLILTFSSDLIIWLQVNAKSNLLARNKDYKWSSFFLFGIWNLWLQRNRKVFKQKNPNPELRTTVEMQTREFMYCVAEPRKDITKTPRLVRWTKPPEGWLKLNTDGFVISFSGLVGGGGLLRDRSGHRVKGFAKAGLTSSSIVAELWALREGLTMCVDLKPVRWRLNLMHPQ